MKISIITPLTASGNPYIQAAYDSLKAQTVQAFEWVVVENHGGRLPKAIKKDPRVKVYREDEREGIGAYKRLACMLSTGDVIVELDHDDWLWPTALERMAKAFESGADFVFTDFAEVLSESMTPNTPYRADCGWTTYPVEWQGHQLIAHRSPPVTPQNVRLIDWSPNHARGWTRQAYDSVGGHDPAFHVGDDHDLIVRMVLAGKRFVHVPSCEYGYRVYSGNTVRIRNAEIRAATERIYNRSIWALAEKFTDDGRLAKVDLCGGIDCPAGYTPYDLSLGHDLTKTWPIADDSVGVLRAHDAIEHLPSHVHTMNEAYRVLAPGGFLMISVPSAMGQGGVQDPDHKSMWVRNSFLYYTNARYSRYAPQFKGRFAVSRIIEWFPSEWHRETNTPYIEAALIALKSPYQHMGEVLI